MVGDSESGGGGREEEGDEVKAGRGARARAFLLVAIEGEDDDGEEVGELGADSANGFAD